MSAPLSTRPRLELRRERNWKRPTIRVHARAQEASPSEWGSLLGDLTRGTRAPAELDVAWRIHDKTHLELAIDYPFERGVAAFTWEAFFFVPDSFRLEQTTYDKKQIYDDLLSYVRLAVPELPFAELADSCDPDRPGCLAADLRSTLLHACGEQDGSPSSKNAVRRLRVFACMVRASGLEAQRHMLGEIEHAKSPEQAARAARTFVTLASRATTGFRKLVEEVERREVPSEVRVALRWVDEDISLFVEALTATASVEVHQRATSDGSPRATSEGSSKKGDAARKGDATRKGDAGRAEEDAGSAILDPDAEGDADTLRADPTAEPRERDLPSSLKPEAIPSMFSMEGGSRKERPGVKPSAQAAEAWADVASLLASEAVSEARYRKERRYPSVGHDDATSRDVEHIEFRRHVLKRFTSSVLWLRHEVRDAGTWILHVAYAFAAAFAMVFAVIATLRVTVMQEYVTLYVVLLVAAYAVKDRMKAVLQTTFARWAQKRFADRAWTIRDEEREDAIGIVKERAGFRQFGKVPAGVLHARRMTREHALEEHARPETVLWHQKTVEMSPRREGRLPSPMMTEIFRLNIGPWLAHTDDPNRTITFADPDEGVVCSVTARRVYNINVVYRLRKVSGKDAADLGWRRIRLVVSRKGIERIDPII